MGISKPPGAHWTDDQWRAISERGSNVLVAAAAGSGKTAVLVERIIRRITDESDPVDVDRLLVATFTKAAADEMRHRIREALELRLAQNRGDEHLTRQLALLNKASITTLHSFCLEVVQAHFYKIPIDPVFRIANETEAELLKSECLEEMFEEEYARSDHEDFLRLVDCFGGERGDEDVVSLVLRLYEFSRSHPWPDHWLEETASRFRASTSGALPPLFDAMLREVEIELRGCRAQLDAALDLCGQPGGPQPYREALNDDRNLLQELTDLTEAGDWNLLKQRLDQMQFARLKACRGDEYDPVKVEMAQELRNSVKKKIVGLRNELFQRTAEQYADELAVLSPHVEELVRLVKQFAGRYAAKKQEKGLVDFNDLEHYCLAILRDPASAPNDVRPSDVALMYRQRFAEVLIDEYQDTNRVQEMIVELISRSEGNRFMVGDVKQSIYRFRLADPGLFLEKYRDYKQDGDGRRIDLSQNFRSRREVIEAVNFIFRQIMFERAAEITYDESAELKYGAQYYEEADGDERPDRLQNDRPDHAVELLVSVRTDPGQAENPDDGSDEGRPDAAREQPDGDEDRPLDEDYEELEQVQIEARMIGLRILELTGRSGSAALPVYDKAMKSYRAPTYRDIVILLRAAQTWAPVIIEELRLMGIPAYADLNTGYFMATEVQVMISLLKVIDNPLQDIPLAGVLRSPMFRFSAEDLARIRILSPHTAFFEAVEHAANAEASGAAEVELRDRLRKFLGLLNSWRTEARQGSLADLIWRIYRETGYYDLVGGLPGGAQRQANLRALYDRARMFEATSFRGLFRFLRFIERLQDSGSDLGTARALGEQEDVVRIMSIHKSKGLEFPVVFVAGLAKPFNERDLHRPFLIHKDWGFGPKYIDPVQRISLPSLAWMAVRRQLRAELLAEEMRILYVALTRAREKLILVSSFRKLENELAKWRRLAAGADGTLSDHAVRSARSYADWIFPALARHPDVNGFAAWGGGANAHAVLPDRSRWRISLVSVESLMQAAAAREPRTAEDLKRLMDELPPAESQDHLQVEQSGEQGSEWLAKRFEWRYPHKEASAFLSKITVTEIKRLTQLRNLEDEEEEAPVPLPADRAQSRIVLADRPLFMGEAKISAAERGIAYHTVMQHVPLHEEVTAESVAALIERLVSMELLTAELAKTIDAALVADFFRSDLGRRMAKADRLYREQPFSYRLPAGEVYREAEGGAAQENMLVQGVIDCMFVEPDGIVLVDYKTDRTEGRNIEEVAAQYDIQIELYARAVAHILGMPVKESYLYFFDGPHLMNRSHRLGASRFRPHGE